MLRSLYIKNYALIEEITVHFERGLNIITGETGAGKSIILDAFSLLIGERSSSDIVRRGAQKAVVEAEFELHGNPKLSRFLQKHELLPEGDILIIRREVQAKGSSRGFVNDTPASTQLLKELGDHIVDLHGQHEHQSLLSQQGHIVLLDEFAGLDDQIEEYRAIRHEYEEKLKQLQEIRSRESRLREERDLYEFQLNEILLVDPKANEDTEIEEELKILENAEELTEVSQKLHATLYNDEGSVYERLTECKAELDRLIKYDSSLTEQLTEMRSSVESVAELSRFFGSYAERVQHDPPRLAKLRERIQSITRLKKKYGAGSLGEVLRKKQELEARLEPEEAVEERIAALTGDLETLSASGTKAAFSLSQERKQTASELEPAIANVLKDLGIEHGRFEVKIASREVAEALSFIRHEGRSFASDSRGMDHVEFYLSTNAGESPKPLSKVASGGEISRIMLALKTILAKSDRMPLMVFDEIDVGISGRIAQRVGQIMKSLGTAHQIIAITHLAQIAAFADAHFLVEKSMANGVTSSRLVRLTETRHVEEVARLISGADVSQSSLDTARELILQGAGQKPKKAKAAA